MARERLVADLVVPPRFAGARFQTYVPDPQQPSQAQAVAALHAYETRAFAAPARRRLFSRTPPAAELRTGVYLDGGFGVGKTHLLASLWHAAPAPKAFATFVQMTSLVGALGFAGTVDALRSSRLLCIDEFELDDPGDTVLVSSLLTRLAESGVRVAATSNTLPGALGEGRFAADDFLREIQGLADRFEVLRVDGEDYRHRGLPPAPEPLRDDALAQRAASSPAATLDDFDDLLAHLERVHPSRYGAMLDGVQLACLRGVHAVSDQNVALRLVAFADRLYDREVTVASSGMPFDRLFPGELLGGGYRKKYLRAISRLVALTRPAPPRPAP